MKYLVARYAGRAVAGVPWRKSGTNFRSDVTPVNIWPVTIYPSGKVEVVFQHLRIRPPFDDVTLREEFRQRLNKAPGVDIAAAKIELRPGFPVKALLDPATRAVVRETLQWFYEQARSTV